MPSPLEGNCFDDSCFYVNLIFHVVFSVLVSYWFYAMALEVFEEAERCDDRKS